MLVGLPVRVVLDRLAGQHVQMPTPFLGMGVVVVIGWYWYGPFGGLRPLTLGLVGFGVVTSVVLVIANRLEWRRAAREIARRLSTAGIVAAGVAAVLTLSWGALFAGPFATNGAHSNNDMPSYALLGQFVADHGPDEAGPIVGYPLGDRTQSSFDFGVVAVVAAASVGPIAETWRSQMPIMAVAVGLVAFVLAASSSCWPPIGVGSPRSPGSPASARCSSPSCGAATTSTRSWRSAS